jgi:choline dehydrogenase
VAVRAGCVLANRLSEDPATRVCLVEAGMDRNARKAIVRIPLAMVTFMAPALAFLGGPKFMSWFETEPEPRPPGPLDRSAARQGHGRLDECQWPDLHPRPARGLRPLGAISAIPGWGYDDLLPYFRKLERFEILAEPVSAKHIRFGNKPLEKQIDPAYHGTDGTTEHRATAQSVNPMAEVFLEAAQQAGHPLNADFNGERQNGVGLYTFTQKNGERVTAEGAYLDPVRHRPNLTVMSETEVTRVVFDGQKATGIACRRNGQNSVLGGREIILSAGSFASPHLLMLSGIGNAKDLTRHGIPVIVDLPGVGENLQDHLDVTIEYRAKSIAPYGVSWRALPRNIGHVLNWIFNKRGLFSSTTGEGGGFISTDPASDRPDIQLFFCTGRANTQAASGFTGHGFLIHICQLRPGSIGRVSLKSADPNDKPSILYNFFRGDSTMDVLRKGCPAGAQDCGASSLRTASGCRNRPWAGDRKRWCA